MTHTQVIELVEKYLADSSSVTTDELKRAYDAANKLKRAYYAAHKLKHSYDAAHKLKHAHAADAAYFAYKAADSYASNRPYSGAAYSAKAAKHVKQYHEQLAEQSK